MHAASGGGARVKVPSKSSNGPPSDPMWQVRVVALFDGAAATLFDGRRAIGDPQCFVLGSAQTRDLRRHGSGVRCGLGMEAKAAPSDRSRSGP